MNPNKALWEKGDFTRIAASMRASGEALVSGLQIGPGDAVLDLGCGDGTTALPAARRGARVLGVDIASNLVAAGNRRAREQGLADCRFEEGDACDLAALPAQHFDWVLSIFGAMFAPRPDDVAREMVRLAKPGGRIVMGNWIPDDPTLVAQVLRISSAYSPAPAPGFVSPMRWGVEADVIARFTQAGVTRAQIRLERASYLFDYPAPPLVFLDQFQRFYGPTMNAFEAARAAGREGDLRRELERLFLDQNTSSDPDRTLIPATYLLVHVTLPWNPETSPST